jgi:hypothetical protein
MTLNFGWGHDEVEKFLVESTTPQDNYREVTRILLTNVDYLYGGEPGDDSTVCCLSIVPSAETRVMVGPPSKPEDDEMDKQMRVGLRTIDGFTPTQVEDIMNFIYKKL